MMKPTVMKPREGAPIGVRIVTAAENRKAKETKTETLTAKPGRLHTSIWNGERDGPCFRPAIGPSTGSTSPMASDLPPHRRLALSTVEDEDAGEAQGSAYNCTSDSLCRPRLLAGYF